MLERVTAYPPASQAEDRVVVSFGAFSKRITCESDDQKAVAAAVPSEQHERGGDH